jgi:hypothetical protein
LSAGWLSQHFWWGAIILINVPVVAVAMVALLGPLPESRDSHPAAADIAGGLLSTAGLDSLH